MNKPFFPTFVDRSGPEETAFGSIPDALSTISSLTASRDALAVQRTIEQRYGFTPTLRYCADLVAFVEALTDGQ